MKTVSEMISELQKYPVDALVYAYEGERSGLEVIDRHSRSTLGFIDAEYRKKQEVGNV